MLNTCLQLGVWMTAYSTWKKTSLKLLFLVFFFLSPLNFHKLLSASAHVGWCFLCRFEIFWHCSASIAHLKQQQNLQKTTWQRTVSCKSWKRDANTVCVQVFPLNIRFNSEKRSCKCKSRAQRWRVTFEPPLEWKGYSLMTWITISSSAILTQHSHCGSFRGFRKAKWVLHICLGKQGLFICFISPTFCVLPLHLFALALQTSNLAVAFIYLNKGGREMEGRSRGSRDVAL